MSRYIKVEPDEAMVLRLLAGPCREARGADRRVAVDRLLREPARDSYPTIARRIGVSPRTVERRAKVLGLADLAVRPDIRPRVLELRTQGLSYRAIGRAVGVTHGAVGNHIRALRQQGVL